MSEADERARLCGCHEPTWHGGQAEAPRTYTADEVRRRMEAAYYLGWTRHRPDDVTEDVRELLEAYEAAGV